MRSNFEIPEQVIRPAVHTPTKGMDWQFIWLYGFLSIDDYEKSIGFMSEWESMLAPSKDAVAVFRFIREAPIIWNGEPKVRSNLLWSDTFMDQVEKLPPDYIEGAWAVQFGKTDVMINKKKVAGKHYWSRGYPIAEGLAKTLDAELYEQNRGRVKVGQVVQHKRSKS